MTSTLVSRRDVDRAIAAALNDLGYRKAAGAQGFFLKPVREDVNGWVSYFTHRTPGGEIEITPTVGVRHERIHELIDRLQSRRRDPSEPTATIILGYLMPQNTANVVWRFEAETSVAEQARNLAEHVVRYGEPWVRERASEMAIIDEVRTDRQIHPERLPTALLLAGRPEEARTVLNAELSEMRDRTDESAQDFRDFAERFEAEVLSPPRRNH